MATTITFDLTGLPEKALIKIAAANSLDPETYAHNIVIAFLNDQVRGFYQKKFNSLTTQQMIQIFGDMT